MVLLEKKKIISSQAGWRFEVFFIRSLSSSCSPLPQLCAGLHAQPRPPRGSGLLEGEPRQLLPPNSPGFQAGRWVITLLLSGISYFRSLYLYHGSCSVM